jgi:two-component system sensor histidine kinase QseC
MRIWPGSLQGRLLAGLLGAVVVVWLAAAVAVWRDAAHELDELLDSHLAQAAALLVVRAVGDLDDDDLPTPVAPQLHRYAPRVAFQVWHGDQLALHSANAPLQPMLPLDSAPGFHAAAFNGTAWRIFAAAGQEPDVQVLVGEQRASRDDILLAVARGMLMPLGLALPLLAVAVWAVVRAGTAPLRVLGRTLAARDPQALAPVQLPDAPAEMRPMLDALNRLFERIATVVAAERRFTADAAHELRTPIAAIRTQAQVALAETDAADRAHALRATLAGCDRATRLVEQLLTLSRLEAGAEPPPTSPLDLGAVAQQVVADAAPRALARGQDLGLDARPGCRLQANEALLAVLLRNLVDNALRYSPADAEVRVAVDRLTDPADPAGDRVRLVVEDAGPGLADAEIARLGERFFRVLGSGQDGSGLGWSIVRRIAEVQRARVAVARSAALGGLAVTVDWPAA